LFTLLALAISAQAFSQTTPASDQKVTIANAPAAQFKSKVADDWARQLPDFLPAIQKCVNDSGVRSLFVVKAWTMKQGMIGMRLHARTGQYICTAARNGMRLGSIVAVSTHEKPMAGNPIFFPAPEEPIALDCGRVERVFTGKLVAGWLQYDPCPLETPPAREGMLRSGFGMNL
jgi:hypothetical protein